MSITQLLKESGLSVTAQRIAVAEVVEELPHATADEVVSVVKGRLGAVSKQAVYSVLGVFVEKGIVRRIQPSKSSARYERRVGDNHHHLVCRKCGVVKDVECATGKTPCLEAANDHGFRIDEAEVIYWGYCPSCDKAQQGEEDENF